MPKDWFYLKYFVYLYNLQIDLKHKRYERFSFDLKIKKSVTSMLIIV